MRGFFTANRVAKIGIFSALAIALYFLHIPPLPIFPAFLTLNFSDLPVLICGFAMGPLSSLIVLTIKIIVKLPFSTTMYVGELADFIIGLAYVLPASLIYKREKSKKKAVIGLISGSLCSTVVAMFINWLILIPFYIFAMGMTMEKLVLACRAVFGFITADNFYVVYIFLSVLPFNILRCLIADLITFLVYKRISGLLKRF